MTNERMTNDERKTAESAFLLAKKIVEELKDLHRKCDELTTYHGWSVDCWELSESAMKVAVECMGIAAAIGYDDGWIKDEKEVAK